MKTSSKFCYLLLVWSGFLSLGKTAISKGCMLLRSLFIPLPFAICTSVSCKLILAFFFFFWVLLCLCMFLWICGLLVQCTAAVSNFLSKTFKLLLTSKHSICKWLFPRLGQTLPENPRFFLGGECRSLIPIVIPITHIWFESSDSDKNLLILPFTKQVFSESFILSRSTVLLKSLAQPVGRVTFSS